MTLGDDKPQFEVTLTEPLYLGKYPVTQADYVRITGQANPSWFCATGDGRDRVKGQNTDRFPVEEISHDDAKALAVALGKRLGVGWREARLPTEAEWEWACRAGTATPYHVGDELQPEHAHFDQDVLSGSTREVGQGVANAWGLRDMHGNVWEWCADWYGQYPSEPQTNWEGVLSGSSRVFRGGSWWDSPRHCRSAHRSSVRPEYRWNNLGVRLALVPRLVGSK